MHSATTLCLPLNEIWGEILHYKQIVANSSFNGLRGAIHSFASIGIRIYRKVSIYLQRRYLAAKM